MVQDVGKSSTQQQNYGSINRVGTKNDGRIVYQVTDPQGNVAGLLSVAPKDTDTFERSYSMIMHSAPKIQKYLETTPPEKIEKMENAGKWITRICTGVGAAIPLIMVKGSTLKQVCLTLAGTLTGFLLSSVIRANTTTPPGVVEYAKAKQALTKLDVQQEM